MTHLFRAVLLVAVVASTLVLAAGPVVADGAAAAPAPESDGLSAWYEWTFNADMRYGWLGIGLLVGGLAAGLIMRSAIRRWWLERAKQTDTRVDDLLAAAFARLLLVGPFAAGFLAFVWCWTLYFGYSGSTGWRATWDWWVDRIALLALYLFLLYAAFHLIGVVGQGIKERFGKTKTQVDDELAVVVTRLLQIAVVAVALVMLLDLVGVSVTAVLVGLGILTVMAFVAGYEALRDMAASLQLLGGAPFDVGDVIMAEAIVGTVTRIGLRSTALETPERTRVVVPNSFLVRHPVENLSRRRTRRYSYTLELAADSPADAVESALGDIVDRLHEENTVVRRHEQRDANGDPVLDDAGNPVTTGNDPLVALEGVEDGALHVLVQYDLNELAFPAAAAIQQRLMLDILATLEQHGIPFAHNGHLPAMATAATSSKKSGSSSASGGTKSASKTTGTGKKKTKKSAAKKNKKKKSKTSGGKKSKKTKSATSSADPFD